MNSNEIKILTIESSCDETAAAIVVDGREVKSNIIYSQIELHKLYGGVVPEIASRKHVEKVNQVIRAAIEEAHVTWDDIDAVAVTYGPGLVGALLVGVSAAKAVAYAKKKPLVGVHHIEGHIAANYIEHPDLEPPFMCMVASGGHSHLVYVKDYTTFEIVGRTRDDAAGEAFDKVARAIGLGYPGGPKIDKLAKEGNKEAIHFPRAFMEDAPYDFSFSGLKSAVLNYLNGCEMKHQEINRADVAASFQQAVVDVLTDNSVRAAKAYGCKKLALAGGVASNSSLRENMQRVASEQGLQFYYPSPIFCTDNAAMIGIATFFIVLIVAWLINYMVRFMLEKRSREFGIYLLIGMNKKEVSGLYMKENLLLGVCSFVIGLGLGMLLQQVLLVVLYSVIQVELRPHLEFNGYCFLMTVCCFAGCYLLALFRCSRKFRKMNIHDLMRENQKNEELKEKNEK